MTAGGFGSGRDKDAMYKETIDLFNVFMGIFVMEIVSRVDNRCLVIAYSALTELLQLQFSLNCCKTGTSELGARS